MGWGYTNLKKSQQYYFFKKYKTSKSKTDMCFNKTTATTVGRDLVCCDTFNENLVHVNAVYFKGKKKICEND